MSIVEIALAAIVVGLLLGWLASRLTRHPGPRPAGPREARIDTVAGWPPQATRIMTTQERTAFDILRRAMPGAIVLAQVPLARFLEVPKRNSYADWLRRVGYQSVDFVICNSATQVLAAVDIQVATPNEREKKRSDRMQRTLRAAGIRMHVWREDALPSAETARAMLVPDKPAGLSAAAGTANDPAAVRGSKRNDPADYNPLEDSSRDSSFDERIELLEPPPSTWFDDLDTDQAALGKR